MVTPEPLTYLQRLEAARDRLERFLDTETEPVKVVQLTKEYRATLAEIAALEATQPKQKGTALDELADRRKAAGRPDASRQSGSAR